MHRFGQVAQLVERRSEKPEVGSSTLPLTAALGLEAAMGLHPRAITVLGLLAVAMLLGGSRAAVASFPGENGRLVYDGVVADEGPGGSYHEIFTMNPDGSDVRRLTFDGGEYECCAEQGERWRLSHNRSPAWSPLGDTIAYVHQDVQGATIRFIDPEGRSKGSLSTDFSAVLGLSWSPDGEYLAVRASDWPMGDGSIHRVGIWVLSINGSDRRLIVVQEVVVDYDDPTPILLSSGPEWSPAGDEIAYGWDRTLHLVHPDGTNARPIVCGYESSDDVAAFSSDPEWWPNGQGLYCSSGFWHVPSGSSYGPDFGVHSVQEGNLGSFHVGLVDEVRRPISSPDAHELLFIGRQDGEYGLWRYDPHYWITDRPGWTIDWQPRQGPFWDDEQSVFVGDTEWLALTGITKGCNPPNNDKFCPSSHVTRGQMAAFLVRALGLTARLDDPFTDDDGHLFEADIEKLGAAGITKGCNPEDGSTKFCPDAEVTRGQMAAFLVRAMGYTDNGGGDLFIDDNGSIFENDIDKLGTAGVTKGCNPEDGNTKFCPDNHVTRGQMAAFLHRALKEILGP